MLKYDVTPVIGSYAIYAIYKSFLCVKTMPLYPHCALYDFDTMQFIRAFWEKEGSQKKQNWQYEKCYWSPAK